VSKEGGEWKGTVARESPGLPGGSDDLACQDRLQVNIYRLRRETYQAETDEKLDYAKDDHEAKGAVLA
jgi:hypothetical protein